MRAADVNSHSGHKSDPSVAVLTPTAKSLTPVAVNVTPVVGICLKSCFFGIMKPWQR